MPVFCFDYLHGTCGSDDEGDIPQECLFAHVVPQEGMDPEQYAVERLKRDILWLGHSKVILKSDNERSIIALLRNTLKALRIEQIENAQEAHPAAYDSSSNGSIEVACRTVAGLVATMRACLESRLRRQIPVGHCSFAWLVEHAAWKHTVRLRQSDGITAHQRLRGMSFGLRMRGFGEVPLQDLEKESRG